MPVEGRAAEVAPNCGGERDCHGADSLAGGTARCESPSTASLAVVSAS
jgi:hypothetical protein